MISMPKTEANIASVQMFCYFHACGPSPFFLGSAPTRRPSTLYQFCSSPYLGMLQGERQKDKKTERQKDKKTKRQKYKNMYKKTKIQRDKKTTITQDKGTKRQKDKKTRKQKTKRQKYKNM